MDLSTAALSRDGKTDLVVLLFGREVKEMSLLNLLLDSLGLPAALGHAVDSNGCLDHFTGLVAFSALGYLNQTLSVFIVVLVDPVDVGLADVDLAL